MRQLAFENLIGAFFETLTSKTIIEADGNGTRPVLPYITMKVFSGVKIGEPHYSKADGNGDQVITYPVDYSISLQGYGTGSIEGLEDIQENLQKGSTIEFCNTNGIGIRSSGEIKDISGLLDSTIEKRYSLDLKFGTMREVNNGSGYISNIAGVGTIDNITTDI
jgi:hypothetical protein